MTLDHAGRGQPTASQHLVLSASGAKTLCGSPSRGETLDIAYADLGTPAVRDHVCRACLREWLTHFTGGKRPSWASEVLG